ncbi:MAG: hypothetical protein WC890_01305 [Candidatus Margulisiibacteriota bacterium]
MVTFSGIQANTTIKTEERLDINPMGQPSYFVNDQAPVDLPLDSGKAKIDFSSARDRAVFILHSRKPINMRNYIPNLPEYFGAPAPEDRQACSGDPDMTHGTNGTEGTSSSNNSRDVEGDAVDAADALMDEASAVADYLENGEWTKTDPDTGYEYIDPEFYVYYEKLNNILNALQIVGAIIDGLNDLKKAAFGLLAKDGASDDSSMSVSEAISTACEAAKLMSQGQLMEMSEEVWTFNSAKNDREINKAKEDASAGVWSWITYCWTIGANDAVQRDKDEQVAAATSKIMDNYETFMKDVQQQYERVLGDSSLYEDGLTDIASIYNNITWENLTQDIGGNKVDIDRNKIMAYQMYLDSMQNYRRLYFMLQRAKQDLKNIIIEGQTGFKTSSDLSVILGTVLQGIEEFEGSVFSAMAYQLQSAISAQNQAVDAYDSWQMSKYLLWSAWDPIMGGGVPLLGGLTRNITDFFALEYWNLTTDDTTTPTQLDVNDTYRILADLYNTSVSQIRNEINNYDDELAKLDDLQQSEWAVIGQLSSESVTYTGSDGIQGIYESKINSLRESLNSIQNAERLVVMLIEAKVRLTKVVLKLTTGLGNFEVDEAAGAALKAGMDSRLLAFDLKLAGIKNKVENANKQKQEAEMVEKAAYVALGSAVGVGIAIVLLVLGIFTGGASVVVAIGFIAAMGQLGAAVGQIVYNAVNKIDDNIYDKTDYYSVDKTQDEIEKMYNSQLDKIDENSHGDGENSKDPLSAGDQWVKDTELFMEVRNELTKIYLYEQIMLMTIKAQEDLKFIALSNSTGVFLGGDFQEARETAKARMDTKVKAYELKTEMVEDIISRRNLNVSQKTETNWAIVSAAISAISIVCAGFGTVAEEALQKVLEGAQAGLDIAGAALNSAKNYFDATAGYGELEEYKNNIEMITLLTNNCFDSESQQILRGALTDMQAANMTTSIGSGQVAVNSSLYYENMRAIQCLYNRIILSLRVAEAICKVRARIAGAPSSFGAADAVEAEKANYLKQLDLAFESVQTYVDRSNEMAQAWRQLAVSATLVVVQILMKVSEKFELTDKIKDKLGDWAEGKLETKDGKIPEITLIDSVKIREKLAGALTGQKAWDGTIGVRDLTSGIVDLATNSTFLTFIINKIYDGSCNRNAVEAKKGDKLSTNTGSTVNNVENAAYNNQLNMATLQLNSEALGMEQQKLQELQSFITSMIQDNIDSIMNDTSKLSLDAFNGPEQLGKGREGSKELPIPVSEQAIFARQLQRLSNDVNWKDSVSVSNYFRAVDQLVAGAKNAEENPLDENQRQRMAAAAAILVAEKVAQKDAQSVVQNIFDTQLNSTESRSQLQLKYAEAILAAMAKNAKGDAKRALDQVVNSRIFEVWRRVASNEMNPTEAKEICSLVAIDRPEVVATAMRTADLLKDPDSVAAALPEQEDPEKLVPKRQLLIDIFARAKVLEGMAKTENPTPEQIASYQEHLALLRTDVVKLQALFEGVAVGSERYQAIEAEFGIMDENQLASCLLGLKEDKGFKKLSRFFPNLGMCIGEAIDILQTIQTMQSDAGELTRLATEAKGNLNAMRQMVADRGYAPGKQGRLERKLERREERGVLLNSQPDSGSGSFESDFVSMVTAVADNSNHSGGDQGDSSDQGFGRRQQNGAEVWEGWMDAQNGVTAGREGGVSV